MQRNVGCERAVLAGMCQYNGEAFFDCADLLTPGCFTDDCNNAIYRTISELFKTDGETKLDPVLIKTRANNLGFGQIVNGVEQTKFLANLFAMPVKLDNVRKFSIKIRKLEIARLLHNLTQEVGKQIEEVTGDESIDKIMSLAESPLLEFSNTLNNTGTESENMNVGLEAYLENIEKNPNKTIGISTGYRIFDASIGGGLRRKTVSLIGARTKVGKTQIGENSSWYISNDLKIPTLYLDSEMNKEDHWARLLANLSNIEIDDIEKGKYVGNKCKHNAIHKAKELMQKNDKLKYHNIAGMEFTEILSIIRRWLFKTVKYDANGRLNDCVVVYDYFKLMSSSDVSKNLQETQILGFMMTELQNFAIKYDVPIFSFVQLNRDGIDNESTGAISQSDRIAWYCSNFSIFKLKSDEEVAEDGPKGGNRKLIPIICRHGPALERGEYICMNMQGKFGRVRELCLNTALEKNKKVADGNDNQGAGDSDIPFQD
jgi:replicative DNA helicase